MNMLDGKISKQVCLLWLRIASIVTIITGAGASFASHPNGDFAWRILFDLLKGFDPQRPTAFTSDNYGTNAVLGGVMIGWGTMMFCLVSQSTLNEGLRRIFIRSLFAWFICDCAGSIAAGIPGNVLLNLSFMIMFLPPLLAIKSHLV